MDEWMDEWMDGWIGWINGLLKMGISYEEHVII